MKIVLNSEFKELIKQNHNANIVAWYESKGFTLEQTLLGVAKQLSLMHNLSLGASVDVVMYDAGFTLDCLFCGIDNSSEDSEVDFNFLATFMENDELHYQLSLI